AHAVRDKAPDCSHFWRRERRAAMRQAERQRAPGARCSDDEWGDGTGGNGTQILRRCAILRRGFPQSIHVEPREARENRISLCVEALPLTGIEEPPYDAVDLHGEQGLQIVLATLEARGFAMNVPRKRLDGDPIGQRV